MFLSGFDRKAHFKIVVVKFHFNSDVKVPLRFDLKCRFEWTFLLVRVTLPIINIYCPSIVVRRPSSSIVCRPSSVVQWCLMQDTAVIGSQERSAAPDAAVAAYGSIAGNLWLQTQQLQSHGALHWRGRHVTEAR